MRFEQYQLIKQQVLEHCVEKKQVENPSLLSPIVMAYIGDAVFSLYVRMRVMPQSNQVRVLHDLASKMVSAVYQAMAMEAVLPSLTEEEQAIVRRGRNAKSTVPKSANVQQYRMATAWEALLGWLLLMSQEDRMNELMDEGFAVIRAAMLNK